LSCSHKRNGLCGESGRRS